ncbi:MAG: dockerin type I domain-containing protein [Candidatus Methanoperedens sp.]|nr:dockerin type I domain-containing protein [Candidatus Methanoperedens sp.]
MLTVTANSNVNIGTLPLIDYDINGDGKINILDMTFIGQHFGQITGKPYPVYDVNRDGAVNILYMGIVTPSIWRKALEGFTIWVHDFVSVESGWTWLKEDL